MKAIHNFKCNRLFKWKVVVGIKDTVYWKQFTTGGALKKDAVSLLLVSKILFIESNSQQTAEGVNENPVVVGIKDTVYWKQFTTTNEYMNTIKSCCWYQRYCLLKAIHNSSPFLNRFTSVVVGIKDTVYWKQFTTVRFVDCVINQLLLVSKILFIESNSQPLQVFYIVHISCCWYQRYCLLKAIHNHCCISYPNIIVVVGIKDTVYWKQFTTSTATSFTASELLLVSKILFIESNSQPNVFLIVYVTSCCWYQRYCLLKAIHNGERNLKSAQAVVVGIKDTVYWKQFTT